MSNTIEEAQTPREATSGTEKPAFRLRGTELVIENGEFDGHSNVNVEMTDWSIQKGRITDYFTTIRVSRGDEVLITEDPVAGYSDYRESIRFARQLETEYDCSSRTVQFAYLTRDGDAPSYGAGIAVPLEDVIEEGVDIEAAIRIRQEVGDGLGKLAPKQEQGDRRAFLRDFHELKAIKEGRYTGPVF